MYFKASLLILFVSISIISFSQASISLEKLYKNKDGIYVDTQTEKPFSGTVFQKFNSGTIGMKGQIINGFFDGTRTWWYADGSKKRETNYTKGRKNGYSYWWYKNGVMKSEIKFASDRNIEQKLWDKEGQRLPNPKMTQQ